MKFILSLLYSTFLPMSLMADPVQELPKFENKAFIPDGLGGGATQFQFVYWHNDEIFRKLLNRDKKIVIPELRKRLANETNHLYRRLLCATLLVCLNDANGQQFFLNYGRSIKTYEETKNLFWIFGNLEWSDQDYKINYSMKWAEDFMVEMLSTPKLFERNFAYDPPDRRSMALDIRGGNFGSHLGKMKNQKLYNILVDFWKKPPESIGRDEILYAFGCLADKRAIPLLLKALKEREGNEYRYAASALAKMQVQEAIPILLQHLDDSDTYNSLASYQDARILPALQKAIPNLKGYALGGAKMLAVDLNGKDKLSQYIALFNDPNHESMSDPLWKIQELKAPRAIPFAVGILKNTKKLHDVTCAIWTLKDFPKSNVAKLALINALTTDFNALASGKDSRTAQNKIYRSRIADALNKMTGQSFGSDQKKWLNYHNKQTTK